MRLSRGEKKTLTCPIWSKFLNYRKYLKQLLIAVQQKIRENQNIFAERQEANIDHVLSNGYKFKKRGNEGQHKHNVKVMSKFKAWDGYKNA